VLGLPVSFNAYRNILAMLGAGGYRDETLGRAGAVDYGDAHFTCFQFDYDWRRDLAESARRLGAFIRQRRAYVQAECERRYGPEDADVRFDIVAHSMGGLVARYFLRYGEADLPADGSEPETIWDGARYVDRVILIGTPNAGSLDALFELRRGASSGPSSRATRRDGGGDPGLPGPPHPFVQQCTRAQDRPVARPRMHDAQRSAGDIHRGLRLRGRRIARDQEPGPGSSSCSRTTLVSRRDPVFVDNVLYLLLEDARARGAQPG
jgi:hypothetical protein